jgi:hypothetical protein
VLSQVFAVCHLKLEPLFRQQILLIFEVLVDIIDKIHKAIGNTQGRCYPFRVWNNPLRGAPRAQNQGAHRSLSLANAQEVQRGFAA